MAAPLRPTLTITGTDDPMLGVEVDTPGGVMWFVSTDEAVGLISALYPTATLELERGATIDRYRDGRII